MKKSSKKSKSKKPKKEKDKKKKKKKKASKSPRKEQEKASKLPRKEQEKSPPLSSRDRARYDIEKRRAQRELEQKLAYEEAIRQRREGDKKLKINDAEKEDNDESISEAKQNTALEALMKILEKYPNPQEYQDLQFLFFKIEQGEPVIISGIEDLVIRDGLATIFKLFRMQKVKQEDNDIGYVKSRATPNLLQFFEKGVSNLPKVEPAKEEEKKPLQKGPVLPGYAERAAYLQTMKEPDPEIEENTSSK